MMRWNWSFVIAVCLLGIMCMPGAAQSPATTGTAAATTPKADIIFMHANIYTGVPANTPFSSVLRAEAIAVRGDRIQAVGKAIELEKLKGPDTQVIDLEGHFVMPGFNDAHLHLDDAGTTKLSVDLTGVKSLEDLRARVAKKVEESKAGDWILGSGWDETLWPVRVTPTRWDLDEVSSGHPVFLVRIDGHIAVANTRALQLGSVTLASRDPQGGKIDRNENGEPTGILRETAQSAVTQVIPKATHRLRREGLELALADLAQHGVTSAQDYSPNWENFQIYEELEKEGKLTARISEWLPFDDSVEELEKKRNSHPQSDLM
ncbi:MAG: amidohydrolase, partial [Acidobacteria bacterium]